MEGSLDTMEIKKTKIRFTDFSFHYGARKVLDAINANFAEHSVTAIVGPSGQGKSTLLTAVNRLWEEDTGGHVNGCLEIFFNGTPVDIYRAGFPVNRLRRKVGLVFQDPNPLPMSIYKNVAFPLKLTGRYTQKETEKRICAALKQAFLWDEVKDRLGSDARTLSGGQQQRLCIARALMLKPEVLLLDEPTASLDPQACEVVEQLIARLRSTCTILMVSHYMDQVHRIADRIMKLTNGRLADVEKGPLFQNFVFEQ